MNTLTTRDPKECDQTQSDERRLPGDGARAPCKHIVRIVVVPRDGARSLPQSHGLTEEVLKESQQILEKMSGPPGPNGTPAPQGMFQALKPTDIVVIGREAASVRLLDKNDKNSESVAGDESGQPVSRPTSEALPSNSPTRRLTAHDGSHKDTVLRVWTNSDTIEYQCDQAFEIVNVQQAGWRVYGAPANPFARDMGAPPYQATRTLVAPGVTVWKWTSSVVPVSANNQQYKATFKIGSQLIDPDVVCGDPPPD